MAVLPPGLFNSNDVSVPAWADAAILHGLTESLMVGVYLLDDSGRYRYVNAFFARMLGYEREELLGRHVMETAAPNEHELINEKVQLMLRGGSSKIQFQRKARRKDGYLLDVEIFGSGFLQNGHQMISGVMIDITTRKHAELHVGLPPEDLAEDTQSANTQDHIWRQARHDHLTGLPNRYLFNECLVTKLAYAERANSPLVVLYLDLDFFKEINDTLGHAWGDELLRQVATRLSKCVRKTDMVARLGGDEFCVIADGLEDEEQVGALCAKITRSLGQPYELGDFRGAISASIGAALFPRDGLSVTDLLHNADLAMYAAKRRGRSEHAFYEASMRRDAVRRIELARDLAQALRKNQFALHYQPILDLETRSIRKVEALLRWAHPEQGLLGPSQFIAQAEDSGLIVRIGEWAFRQATRMLQHWRRRYYPELSVTVNISAVQLMDARMNPEDWLAHLDLLKLPYKSVHLEITERVLLEHNPIIIEKLRRFREAGVRVVLDDFGVGYSSVSYLRRLHIDYLKIEQSFVQQIAEREEHQALCDAVIMMAHRLGLTVVAEGIENEAQLVVLQEMGCDFGQGMHLHSAMPAAQLEAILKTQPA